MHTTTLPKMTPTQYKFIHEQAACYLDGLCHGDDLRTLLAKMYAAAFPAADETACLAHADEVLGAVDAFSDLYDGASWQVEHGAYHEAEPYIESHIARFMKKTEAGMSCAEACTFWKQFAAALACANAEMAGGKSEQSTRKFIEQIRVSEDEASPELLASLHEQVSRVVRHSSIALVGLGEHEKLLRAMADGDKAGKLLIDINGDERAFRAALSMMTGILAKKGELPGVPDTLTAHQSTVLFCTMREKLKIEERYGRDSIPERIACALTMLLGAAAVLAMAAGMLWVGLNIIFDFLHILLFVPAIIALYGGVLFFVHELLIKDSSPVYKLDKPVHLTFIALRAAARGAGRLAAIAAKTLLPAAIKTGKYVFDKLGQLRTENRAMLKSRAARQAYT